MWSVQNRASGILRVLCSWSFRSSTSLNLKFINNFQGRIHRFPLSALSTSYISATILRSISVPYFCFSLGKCLFRTETNGFTQSHFFLLFCTYLGKDGRRNQCSVVFTQCPSFLSGFTKNPWSRNFTKTNRVEAQFFFPRGRTDG
jgi:hypothetical protein